MKKIIIIVIASCFMFSCNLERDQDWQFESDKENSGYIFTKENFSSENNEIDNSSSKENNHKGCSACPKCSK